MMFFSYLGWHYTIAPIGILRISKNFLIGNWHRFLIKRHLMTLFSPWHRTLPSQLPHEQNIGERIINLILDIFIRLLGAVVRSTFIITGLLCQVTISVISILWLIVWLLWPIIFIVAIYKGVTLILS